MHTRTPDTDTEGAPNASRPRTEEPDTPGEDPLAAARALIAEEQQARMQACADEIAHVLEKHGMRLETTPAQITLAPAT